VGRLQDRITFSREGMTFALDNWPAWAELNNKSHEEKQMCKTPVLDVMVSNFLTLNVHYHGVHGVTDPTRGTIFTTTENVDKHRAEKSLGPGGANWFVLKAAYAKLLGNPPGPGASALVKPVFGRIIKIWDHGHIYFLVKLYTTGRSVYDDGTQLVAIENSGRPARGRLVPVSAVCPLHVIVVPHPTTQGKMVVLPAESNSHDTMFLVAAGYDGPDL
jgi:hypothetical protein